MPFAALNVSTDHRSGSRRLKRRLLFHSDSKAPFRPGGINQVCEGGFLVYKPRPKVQPKPHEHCPPDHSYCVILAKGGVPIWVDRVDYERFYLLKWHLNHKGYAVHTHPPGSQPRIIRMHRVIADTGNGVLTDHINGVRTDNRRCNLRHVSHLENCYNRAMKTKNRSGYKGVSPIPKTSKWGSQIQADGKTHRLGSFDTPEDAAHAYNEAAKRLHGRFARLNQLPENYTPLHMGFTGDLTANKALGPAGRQPALA